MRARRISATAALGRVAALVAPLVALAACGPVRSPGGTVGTGRAVPQFVITSPADGARIAGATYFAVQALKPSEIKDVAFDAGGKTLSANSSGETKFRVFLLPEELPAGPLVLTATVTGGNGARASAQVNVEIVPAPPSTATVDSRGAVLGTVEANGATSTLTIPPGVGAGANVSFEARTKAEVKAATGVDYDALGVTFLGAQQITSSDPLQGPLGVSSGGFAPMVQPGQAVLNYMIAPDANGDGMGELVAVNTAATAPDGSVVSDPPVRAQIGDRVSVASSSRVRQASVETQQADTLDVEPGNVLIFQTRGFIPASLEGNKAVFHSLVDGSEVTQLGIVRAGAVNVAGAIVQPDTGQTFQAVVPPLPAGPATLILRNEATGSESQLDLTVHAAPSLSSAPMDVIDGFFARGIAAIDGMRSAVEQANSAGGNLDPAPLDKLERNFKRQHEAMTEMSQLGNADVDRMFEGFATVIQNFGAPAAQASSAPFRIHAQGILHDEQCKPYYKEAYRQLTDGLNDINAIETVMVAGDCVFALLVPVPPAVGACFFGATTLAIGLRVSYGDAFKPPADCSDEPPPPPPSTDADTRECYPTPGGVPVNPLTGMGSAAPPGGESCGSVNAGGSDLNPPNLVRAADAFQLEQGRFVVKIDPGTGFAPFSGSTDAAGYFYIPFIPAGQPFTATAIDRVTGQTRTVDGVGPPIGESLPLHFDFLSLENRAPQADAGVNDTVTLGTTVALDGTGSSDPDFDPLTYAWTVASAPAGSNAAIANRSAATTEITPDVAGEYHFALQVSDGDLTSSDEVTVIVQAPVNHAPVADAGANQSVTVGDAVQLDGSGSSDPDGDALTYTWELSSVPTGSAASLSSTTTATTSFVADVAGDYQLTLTVSDGDLTDSDPVTVTATEPNTNQPPVADAGANRSVDTGTTVTLDGSASSDPDGDTLTYSWSLASKPTGSSAALTATSGVTTSFTADVDGDYQVDLTVSDGQASNTDSVTVTATTPPNSPPTADAGPDQSVTAGDTVALDGSGSTDPDGDALTYTWELSSVPAGSTASLSSATTAATDFVADVAGDYSATLTVSDGSLQDSDTVVVTAQEPGILPIALDSNVDGSFDAVGDFDRYNFDADAGTPIFLGFVSADRVGVQLTLYAPDGSVATQWFPQNGSTTNAIELGQTGTYTLELESTSNAPGAYTLGLSEPTEVVPTFDATGTAEISGSFTVVGQHDYYSLQGQAGVSMAAYLGGTNPLPQGDPEVEVRDTTGASFWSGTHVSGVSSKSGNSANPDVHLAYANRFANAGTYTFGLDSRGALLGNYRVVFHRAPAAAAITAGTCAGASVASVHAALLAVDAGGTVTLCSGTYDEPYPAMIMSDNVTVTGAGASATTLGYGLGRNTLDVQASHVTVQDLGISVGPDTLDRGVQAYVSSKAYTDLTLTRLRIFANDRGSSTAVYTNADDSSLTDLDLSGLNHGMYVLGDRSLVENDTVSDTVAYAVVTVDFSRRGYGVTIRNNTFATQATVVDAEGGGFTIENNDLSVTSTAYGGGTGISVFERGDGATVASVVRNNTIHAAAGQGIEAQVSGAGSSVLVEKNMVVVDQSTDFGMALEAGSSLGSGSIVVRNNVLHGVLYPAIRIFGADYVAAGDSFDVLNNAFLEDDVPYSSDYRAIQVDLANGSFTGDLPVNVADNIFQGRSVATDTAVSVPAGTTIDADYNLFYRYGALYAGGGTRSGTHDLTGDPLFTSAVDANGYQLLTVDPASPAVDAGTSGYANLPTDDYEGISRPQGGGWDMGAHEQ